jgi:hypothetical protein
MIGSGSITRTMPELVEPKASSGHFQSADMCFFSVSPLNDEPSSDDETFNNKLTKLEKFTLKNNSNTLVIENTRIILFKFIKI